MKPKPVMMVLLTLLIASIACSPFTTGLLQEGPNPTPTTSPPTQGDASPSAPASSAPAPQLALNGDLVSLYEAVREGVVTIWSYEDLGAPHNDSLPLGQGSGFVIDAEGHIITNQHVVDGADHIEVDFPSGLKAWAELIGTDPDSDLAVLKVDVPPESLTPLALGDSDAVRVGEFVVAIGNPFGLAGTMTVGIVSAIGRTLDSEHLAPGGSRFTAGDLIQTDAAINPGNSGGPLLNLNGRVIGINRAIQTESFTVEGSAANSGVGFAVPVNILRRVAPSIIERGSYDYPYLGISSLSTDAWNLNTIEALGFPRDAVGAYITEVAPGGPAAKAGLRGGDHDSDLPGIPAGGDLIIAIDDTTVKEFPDLLSYLIMHTEPGQQVVITVLRDGKEMQVELTIGARP